jgi:hypothetical protein
VKLYSCHNRYQKNKGGDPVHRGAERRPPSGVGDELGALLPSIFDTVPSETNNEEPDRSGDS